jgi:hypothetical protein
MESLMADQQQNRPTEPRFNPGDRVMIWKPDYPEHGATGVVARVMPIKEYGGPSSSGPHAYLTVDGFRDSDGFFFCTTLPDYLVAAADDPEPPVAALGNAKACAAT